MYVWLHFCLRPFAVDSMLLLHVKLADDLH